MAEEPVTGPTFKKFVKLAKKQDVPFAFNPGKAAKEHYMVLHRIKPAKLLSKDTKKAGPSNKVGYGLMRVDQRALEFQVESFVPGMAKRLKELLRLYKIPLNVRILDPDGSVLDEDIEDLPDDPEFANEMAEERPDEGAETLDHVEDASGADTADDNADDQSKEDDTPQAIDPKDIVAGIKAIQPVIEAAPATARDKLKKAVAAIVSLIKSGDIDRAHDTFLKLKQATDKLSPGVSEPAQKDTSAEPAADNIRDLTGRVKAAQALIANAPEGVQGKLIQALKVAAQAIKGSDLNRAEAAMGQIEAALNKLGAGAPSADGPETGDDAADAQSDPNVDALRDKIEQARTKAQAVTAGDVFDAIETKLDQALEDLAAGDTTTTGPAIAWSQEAMRLQQAVDALMPDYTRAMSSGAVADPQALRVAFQSAVELVSAKDHSKGWAVLGKAEDMILSGLRDNAQAFLAEVPDGVRDFAVARLNWVSTHKTLYSEMDKLEAAILDACKGQPELQDVPANIGKLRDNLQGIDLRLADALDAIVTAPDEDKRATSKGKARAVLAEYQTALLQPFFREVDNNNGFAEVTVAQTATRVLNDIDKVLAA